MSFWRQKEKEWIELAEYYERVPEDKQKAQGARDARAAAAQCHVMAILEEEEATCRS